MPTISKIRLTNIAYENGNKRINDEILLFDAHNGAILLENGGGKTVFIHTVLQAILPHTNLGNRKIRETLELQNAPAHIGIEWMISEKPRRYVTTVVNLFLTKNKLDSVRYVFAYEEGNPEALAHMPFVQERESGNYPSHKEDMLAYYSQMKSKSRDAQTFETITAYSTFIEEQYKIIKDEWQNVVQINSEEGGIEKFFERCKTTNDLYNQLLIPAVEDSMAGLKKDMFIDMFEKQRDSFKKYHQLKKSMAENEQIKLELNSYLQEFERYSLAGDAYMETKRHAKGLKQAITMQIEENANKLADYKRERMDLEAAQTLLGRQEASLTLLGEREKTAIEKAALVESERVYYLAHEHDKARRHFQRSLTYARERDKKQLQEAQVEQYRAEIAAHHVDGVMDDYEAESSLLDGQLHGWFVGEMSKLTEQTKVLERDLLPVMERLATYEAELEKCEDKLTGLRYNHGKTIGELLSNQRLNLDREQVLLAHPDQEKVATESVKWQERRQFLDEEIITLLARKKALTEESRTLAGLLSEQDAEERRLGERMTKFEQILATIVEEETQLKEDLGKVNPRWNVKGDIYLRIASIQDELENILVRRRREREDALKVERLAFRYVDDYAHQETFFADSFLEGRLQEWNNQQIYVRTGPAFFADIAAEEQAAYEAYPLWPVTLVTTERDKPRVLEKLAGIKQELAFPISLLTLEEARAIGEAVVHEHWIAPAHWQTNLAAADFTDWQDRLRANADEKVQFRMEKEAGLKIAEDVLLGLVKFLEKYDKTHRDEVRDSLKQFGRERDSLHYKMSGTKKRMTDITADQERTEEKREEYRNEMTKLEEKIVQANEYIQTAKYIAELEGKRDGFEVEITGAEKVRDSVGRFLKEHREEKQIMDDEIADRQRQKHTLEADKVFDEIRGERPIQTSKTKDELIFLRMEVRQKLAGITKTYRELEANRDNAGEWVEHHSQHMAQILRDDVTVDTALAFPVNGDVTLRELEEEVRETKRKVSEALKRKEAANTTYSKQDGAKDVLERAFEQDYQGEPVITFDQPLTEVTRLLAEQEKALKEREDYLIALAKRIAEAAAKIDKAERQLSKYERVHGYDLHQIEEIALGEKEWMAFSYDQLGFVKEVTAALEAKKDRLDQMSVNIGRAKNMFKEFCKQNITDRKLQEKTLKGIEYQETYEDVLKYQENIVITLESANSFAENYIAEKDQEVQAFINSLYNHLANVLKELDEIPKKTRVKIADKTREIFKFTIPEIKEEDAKTRIRKHLERILGTLDTGEFKDEFGKEDAGKVRSRIETSLETKQLLYVMMESQVMKVSCRKVTNDNQVTSALTSWEQSNKWSGGEKWSKNMTLFLGILNFVAEKKQGNTNKMKRSKAVILDNPFGKASSDHVLNPVFFIAEQLGFQIIALTAHSDGKFLQDYFPVNYSFKLRPTKDGAKQVMTTEKILHTAFFMDHEPEEMARLESREQLELF